MAISYTALPDELTPAKDWAEGSGKLYANPKHLLELQQR